jgi:uncharacterized protein YutE (UPF0331/DUF86 family)
MPSLLPLAKAKIERLLLLIEESLQSLTRFKSLPLPEFERNRDNFRITSFDLHQALEAVMDIGSHVLSRIPGVRPERYKDIARLLGEHGVVPREFADGPLLKMAGYRNRMVHFYDDITSRELHKIVQENLADFETFSRHVKRLLTSAP